MSEWIVYSKDGQTERCRLKKLEYSGSFMNERAVTSTFTSPVEVEFDVFDYIEYRGEQFELEAIPTVKKTSSFSYEYDLRFVSYKYELERCEMRDIVPHDNGIVYPTPLTFSFMGNVKYLAERIQACLDAMYGYGVWNITIAYGTTSDEHNITISQQNCWNALALVNTTYKLNFYIKGRTITIGGSQPVVEHVFQYGKGNGLYEIERTANTDTGIVTKLRAYGSTRNLDYSYPKRPDWSDSILDTSFVLSPLRLMLPSFKSDGKTDYIMAADALVSQYGIREASIVYEDIYPSITGATHNGQNIDEIKSVGEVGDSTFTVELHDLGFDLEEHRTTNTAQISMKDGTLQGYTFNIQKIEKQEDNSYILTLERITLSEGDSGNYDVPNNSWNMSAGDKFVLLNILMPQEYIRDAEERLKNRAEEYLAQYAKTNFGYSIGIHDKFLIENPSIYEELVEGSKLRIQDEELGISEDVTIQSITITENMEDNSLPQVKVVLNNEPSATTLERIQGQINDLANGVSGSYSKQGDILNQYRRKLDRPYFDKLFVAIDKDGKEIPSNDLTTEVHYILAKYHFATVGGITMYTNDGFTDLPSIYAGLPIDNQTLYWEETTNEDGSITRILKAKGGGEGNGTISNFSITGTGNAITEVSLSSDKKSLNFVKGLTFVDKTFLSENYFTRDEASGLFVTLDEKEQEIIGVKTFLNGLKIGSSKIWQSQEDVIYLDANLVVRGGVTMYAQNNVDIPSFMESLLLDKNTLKLDENGYLTVIGGAGGSIEYALTWSGFSSGSYDGKSAQNIYIPSKVSELTNDSLFATQSWVNGKGYATQSWVNDKLDGYVTELGLESNGKYDRYLTYTKGGTVNRLTVGYATYANRLLAFGATDLNATDVWNANIGLKSSWFASSASNKPTTAGTSANGIITFMPATSYGFQLAYLNQLSTGYDSITHLYVRNYVNGSYKSWYRLVTDGPQMTFDTYASGYMRLRYLTQDWYYLRAYSDGLWIGLSNTVGTRVDSGGNLLVTGGITMYSDERKKTILRNVELSLNEVADAPLIEHYYNSDDKKTTHVGSIAQYWAGLNDWFCKKDSEGFYTMEIQNAALASSISVAREVVRLKERIRELEKEVERFKTA